jgi:IS30 family transposase
MVEKWSVYNPLTIEERILLKEALDLNLSYKEIGLYVGREKSIVIREAKRLGHYSLYDPYKAQEHYENIQINRYKKKQQVLKTEKIENLKPEKKSNRRKKKECPNCGCEF